MFKDNTRVKPNRAHILCDEIAIFTCLSEGFVKWHVPRSKNYLINGSVLVVVGTSFNMETYTCEGETGEIHESSKERVRFFAEAMLMSKCKGI